MFVVVVVRLVCGVVSNKFLEKGPELQSSIGRRDELKVFLSKGYG